MVVGCGAGCGAGGAGGGAGAAAGCATGTPGVAGAGDCAGAAALFGAAATVFTVGAGWPMGKATAGVTAEWWLPAAACDAARWPGAGVGLDVSAALALPGPASTPAAAAATAMVLPWARMASLSRAVRSIDASFHRGFAIGQVSGARPGRSQ